MYHYMDQVRLQLWFFSPNVCGIFLAITGILLTGLFLHLISCKRKLFIYSAWVLSGVIFCNFVALAITYSRGAYAAILTALLFTAIASKRKLAWIFPLLFLAILFLTSHGVDRALSATQLKSDHSIRNRLWLWRGGCAVIYEHALTGCGSSQLPGYLYHEFYQPLELDEHYATLISDPLTLAGHWGIGALFLASGAMCWLLYHGFRLWKKSDKIWILYLNGALFAYCLGGMFSTFYRFWNVFFLPLAIAGGILFFILKYKLSWRKRDFLLPLVPGVILCSAILLAGAWQYHTRPVKIRSTCYGYQAKPSAGESRKTVYLLLPEYTPVVRDFLRPLGLQNWTGEVWFYSMLQQDPAQLPIPEPPEKADQVVLFAAGTTGQLWAEHIVSAWNRQYPGPVHLLHADADEIPDGKTLLQQLNALCWKDI